MGKPSDPGNSTQPLSQSQVLDISAQARPVAKHDQSQWKGIVVSPDEFAPVHGKGSRVRRWAIGGVIAAGAATGGVYAYSRMTGDAPPAAPTPDPVSMPAVAPVIPASVPSDATVSAAPPDAAATAAAGADAVSSAAAPIQKASASTSKKKKAAKKHR
jgi:hypothetical protein